MSKLNEMRMYTWNSTGLNWVDSDISLANRKENPSSIKDSNTEKLESLERAFESKVYGISEDIYKENRDFRNYSKIYDVAKEDKKETEIINLKLDEENNILVSGIDINAGYDSTSSYLITATGNAGKAYLNSQIRVNIEDKARVKLVIVTNLAENSTNLTSVATILGEESYLDISYIEIGADKSLVNIKNILDGDRSIVEEEGVYFKEKDQFLDILAINEHNGNDTNSDAMFNGALKDQSQKNWKGIVDLMPGCVSADGKIGDYSMMFSDEVKNKTAPILLCAEKEVSGNHAASVGRLNKDMLFYIMSRGFDKKTAESMILEATFSKALDKIDDESLRDELKAKVHNMNIGDKND